MASGSHKLAKRTVAVIAVIMVAFAVAFAWYVNDYYHADETALAAMQDGGSDKVPVRELASGDVAFVPDNPQVGLVFYPGAKVQPEAYAPLLRMCTEQNVLCVLVRPMFNLSILEANAADAALEEFPEMETWVLAGHSMGGVAAADYVSHHAGEVDGIVFLAAYPAADLSGFEGDAVSLIGENDGVINRDNLKDATEKLPTSARLVEIEGGNHAYFGNYGEQAGDGEASITREEQQAEAVEEIVQAARNAGAGAD